MGKCSGVILTPIIFYCSCKISFKWFSTYIIAAHDTMYWAPYLCSSFFHSICPSRWKRQFRKFIAHFKETTNHLSKDDLPTASIARGVQGLSFFFSFFRKKNHVVFRSLFGPRMKMKILKAYCTTTGYHQSSSKRLFRYCVKFKRSSGRQIVVEKTLNTNKHVVFWHPFCPWGVKVWQMDGSA